MRKLIIISIMMWLLFELIYACILRFVFDRNFGTKNNIWFSTLFVFRKTRSNAICDLVLHQQSESLNISWIYPRTIPRQYLKKGSHNTVFYSVTSWEPVYFSKAQWTDEISRRHQRIHLFWVFWSLIFHFFP